MKSWVPLILVLASCSSESGGGAASPGPSDAAGTGDAGAPDAPTGSDASAPPPVEWAACDTTDWPTAYPKPSKETECASIEVPLDRGDLSGATLALRVARQRASANPTGRVVFVLEGGPGGSAVFTSGMIPQALPGVLGSFDLVYVDSRGTGGSGYLGCPKQPTAQADWLACAKANAGVPLGHYLSSDNARDLEAVRVRLGYDRIHIFATSYGTRVAFEYLRLFEDKVVAGVLDGVAPPPTDLFTNSVTSGDRRVALLVSDCEADPACTAVAPNLAANLLERRAVLEQTPRPITVDGKQAYEALEDYVALLHALMRDAGWRYRVPRPSIGACRRTHPMESLDRAREVVVESGLGWRRREALPMPRTSWNWCASITSSTRRSIDSATAPSSACRWTRTTPTGSAAASSTASQSELVALDRRCWTEPEHLERVATSPIEPE